MSQTVITLAFEHWKAQQGATGEPVLLDEFVFANVPGLNPDIPVDRSEALPPVEQIVHRQPVTRTGVVNENGVVYSAVLGADVGDFSFNWIGLLNKASGTLAMIVHAPVQQKLKTAEGQQGNVLTRSFLMEYNGAQAETGINTPAETWQIDFTARMAGMDERQRLENADIYGAAAFFGDGWLVGKTGNQFFVNKGTGYVAGLRTSLAANQNITVTVKPVKVWLDVCWTGALTSVWNVQSKITVAENLADYVQNGIQHYVFAVASIDVNGDITDLRPKGTLNEQQTSDALKKHEQSRNHPDATTSAKGFTQLSSATDSASEGLAATSKAVKIAMDNANARLAKERNGGDIPNKPLFVQNIGLQDTVNKAAGALQKDQNLADIPDKAKARAALQLGTVATLDVTSSATDSTLGHVLKVGDRGLGLAAINYVGIDFNTYKFAAGETLFLRMADCTNIPAGIDTGYVVYAYVNVIGIRNVNNNVAVLIGDNGGAKYYWAVRSTNSSGVTTWAVRILPQTAADIFAVGVSYTIYGGNSGKVDFNSAPPGVTAYVYADAAGAPPESAVVIDYWGGFTTQRVQIAVASASGRTYTRVYNGKAWTDWDPIYSVKYKPPYPDLSPYATKSWVLQNFVQNIDLTAPFEAELWDGRGYLRPTDGAAMYNLQMVGGANNVGKFILRYTRKQVNNTWYVLN